MAFPVVEDTSSSSQNTDSTTHTVTLPPGSPEASVVVTTPTSEKSAHTCYRVSGAGSIEAGTPLEQNTDEPNPPALNPAGGSDDYLWVAVLNPGYRQAVVESWPAGYSNNVIIDSGGDGLFASNTTTAMTSRTNAAASEDPGIFSMAITNHVISNTLAIGPGTQEIIVIVFTNDQPNGTAAPAAPTGFSTLFSVQSAETDSFRMTVYYQFVDVGESTSLFATGTQTISDVVNENDTATNLHLSIDDDPATPNDDDWVNNAIDVSGGDAFVFEDVTDLPAEFGNAESGEIIVRTRGQNFGTGTINLYARLYRSDETTALSDEVLVATVTANTAFANSSLVTFTGLNMSVDKTVWDAARVRFRWSST